MELSWIRVIEKQVFIMNCHPFYRLFPVAEPAGIFVSFFRPRFKGTAAGIFYFQEKI
jgi:hypothetical protein